VLKAEVFSFLKEAHESTGESEVIAGELSRWENKIGTKEEAIQILRIALSKEPTNTRLRDLWIIFEIQKKQFSEALKIAMEGERLDPTSWRIQRHIARLSRDLGKPIESVKGHYEAAIRHNKGDISLLIEFGAYLFMKDKFADADRIFAEAKKLQVSGYEKQKIREWWKNSEDEKAIFKGKIVSISGYLAFVIALPENFEASFWRNRYQLSDLRERDSICTRYSSSQFYIEQKDNSSSPLFCVR
jgi:tetratricopeptide (TPR) repeat protein